jgi:uncharacterized membrane protein YfcA
MDGAGELALAGAGALAGGFVQSATGFGFALVAAPALSAALGPLRGVPAAAVLGVLVNVLTLAGERRPLAIERRAAGLLTAASLPGMALGALVLVRASEDVLRGVVAVVVLASVLAYARAPRARRAAGAAEGIAAGVVAGTIGAAAGINGPPLVLYLRRRGAGAVQMRDTLAAIFLATGLLTLAAYAVAGAMRLPDAILLLVAGAGCGQALGRLAFGRLGERRESATRATLALSAALALVPALQALLG